MLHARRTNALAFAVSLCLLALAVLASSAAASRAIGISPAGAITARSSGGIAISGGFISSTCSLGLTGSLQSQVAKVPGAAVGSFTNGVITNCSQGIFFYNFGTGWTMTYDSFSGTLPAIAAIDITTRVSFTMQIAGIRCAWGGPLATQLTPPSTLTVGTSSLPLTGGGMLCPASVSVSGTFAVSPGQTLSLL